MMAVVKADGYGHGIAESARAARDGGADWLGVATIDEALALRAAGDTGRVLCWLTVPGEDCGAAIEQDIDVTAYSVAELDEIAADRGRPARGPAQGRHRSVPRRRPARAVAGVVARASGASEEPSWRDHRHLVALLLQRRAGRPGQRRPGGSVPARRSTWPPAPGSSPRSRHLANSAAAILRPSSRLRPGPRRHRDLRPRPGARRHPRPRAASRDDRPRQPGDGQARRGRAPRSPTAAPGSPTGRPPLGLVPGRVRRRPAARRRQPRRGAGRGQAQRPVRGRICMDQLVVDLDGDDPGAGAEVVDLRARHARRAHRAGLGRGLRHDQLRDRHPDRGTVHPTLRRLRCARDNQDHEHRAAGSSGPPPAPSAWPRPGLRRHRPAEPRDRPPQGRRDRVREPALAADDGRRRRRRAAARRGRRAADPGLRQPAEPS